MDKHLHIVCLDVPYPPDYGGVFDLYYKIIYLHQQAVKIHLHCFEYGRGVQDELNKYCVEVKYYKRKAGFKGFSFRLPYIVNSRSDKNLLGNLLKDNYPILLEGIHCTYFLYQNKLLNRKVFVRLHNVEFEYYNQLARLATSLYKKIYYLLESKLLKKYEKNIADKAMLIAVSTQDKEAFKKEFGSTNIIYLPVFLPFNSVNAKEGKGNYCLYHGNLSVAENEKVILWLLENVFADITIPFVIAGKNPSEKIRRVIQKNENARLISNPSEEEINNLIANAQINILPSFNCTGIKIKLLNALFNGKHCLVNSEAVAGTGLQSLCSIAYDGPSFKSSIINLYGLLFTKEEIQKRKELLLLEFNNEENARQLIQWIY